MGFLHSTIYVQALLPTFQQGDGHLNLIVDEYRAEFSLADYGAVQVDCGAAIEVLRGLSTNPTNVLTSLPKESLRRLEDVTLPLLPDHRLLLDAMQASTPFDIITRIRNAIDLLVSNAEAAFSDARSTGTDELLPLLAYSLVQSGARNLESLLFYAKNFTQSSLGPEYV